MVWGCPQTNQPLLVWGCPPVFTGLGSSDQLFTGSEVVLRSTSCLLVWGCPPISTGLGSSSDQPVFTGLEIILIPTNVYWFGLWGHPQINNVYWSEQLTFIFHFCELFFKIYFFSVLRGHFCLSLFLPYCVLNCESDFNGVEELCVTCHGWLGIKYEKVNHLLLRTKCAGSHVPQVDEYFLSHLICILTHYGVGLWTHELFSM